MIFNKKRDEDLPRDYVTDPRPAAGPLPSGHAPAPKLRKAQTRSVIDPGLIITGTLEGDGDLQIDGEVRGDIRCTHLTVGDAASIEGSIGADEVVVRGKVKGVIGANRVILTDGAHVESEYLPQKAGHRGRRPLRRSRTLQRAADREGERQTSRDAERFPSCRHQCGGWRQGRGSLVTHVRIGRPLPTQA
jgi:bactofilin